MAHYRMELRRHGVVLRTFETEEKLEAKIQAKRWHETTQDAVVILFVDGEEIRLKDTAKALGLKHGEFDSTSRYTNPETTHHILRRAGQGRGGMTCRPMGAEADDR